MGCSIGWAARSAAPAACRARSSTRPGRWPDASAGAFRGGRVVDVAGGHGLLAFAMLLLDRTAADAIVVDPRPPPSALPLHQALAAAWPRLPRVQFGRRRARRVHDRRQRHRGLVPRLRRADRSRPQARRGGRRAGLAVMPCCHEFDHAPRRRSPAGIDRPRSPSTSPGPQALERRGYTVWTHAIPAGDHAQAPVAVRDAAGRCGATR